MGKLQNTQARIAAIVSFLAICLVAAFAIYALTSHNQSVSSGAQSAELAATVEPVSVLTETPLDPKSGIIYSLPKSPPIVTRSQAITIALNSGLLPGKGNSIQAHYVLMTFPQPEKRKFDVKLLGLSPTKYPNGFEDVPVWIVTVRGIKFYGPAGGADLTPVPVPTTQPFTEMNVVVSAETGKCLEVFAFI